MDLPNKTQSVNIMPFSEESVVEHTLPIPSITSSTEDVKPVRLSQTCVTDQEVELEPKVEPKMVPKVSKPEQRKKQEVHRDTSAHIAPNKVSEAEPKAKQLDGTQDRYNKVNKRRMSGSQDTKVVRFDIDDPKDEPEPRVEPEGPKPVPRRKNEVQRDTVPLKSLIKDSEEVSEVKQLDGKQETIMEVDKRRLSGSQDTKVVRFDISDPEGELEETVEPKVPKPVPRRKYERDTLPIKSLSEESEKGHEVKQLDTNKEQTVEGCSRDKRWMSSALSVENQIETSSNGAPVVRPLQPAKMNQKETETDEQKEKLSSTHWEKTRGDDQMSAPSSQEQSVIEKGEQMPLEPPHNYVGNEPIMPQIVTSTSKEDVIQKRVEVPLRPPVRTKGKLTASSKASESSFKEIGERQPSKDDPKQDQVIEDSLPTNNIQITYAIEATEKKSLKPLEETPSVDALEEKAVKTKERPIRIETLPPKPPARTKSRARRASGSQFSRDSEASQDEEQVLVIPVFKKEVQAAQDSVKAFKKKCEENTEGEKEQSVPRDTENEQEAEQLVKSKEKDLEITQPVLPVGPLKEMKQPVAALVGTPSMMPKLDEGRKHAVRPMRLEIETPEPRDNVPLLFITEDDTFSIAGSEKTVDSSNIQPLGFTINAQTQPAPIQLLPQEIQPSQTPTEAPEDIIDIIDNEPEMLEAAVKIQAAFKGYKARKDMRPVFKEVFKNQGVELGGTAHLECVAEGKLESVRWLKHGQQIITDQRHRMKTSENGVLVLEVTNVNLMDSGIYTCEVVNKFGVISYSGNITAQQQATPAATTKPVHPPLAAITPLQPVLQKPQALAKPMAQTPPPVLALPPTQTPVAPVTLANESTGFVVESEGVSLWEAYNLTEQDSQINLQERRRASLIPASSSK